MMHPDDPLRREEPEGWDDHMTANPPGAPEFPDRHEHDPERLGAVRAAVAVAILYVCAALVGMALTIALWRII